MIKDAIEQLSRIKYRGVPLCSEYISMQVAVSRANQNALPTIEFKFYSDPLNTTIVAPNMSTLISKVRECCRVDSDLLSEANKFSGAASSLKDAP